MSKVEEAMENEETTQSIGIRTDITLPIRITHLDLSDLQERNCILQLAFYRQDFDALTEFIDVKGITRTTGYYQIVTRTPGISWVPPHFDLTSVEKLLQERQFIYIYDSFSCFSKASSSRSWNS
jgi:hypothetical protein